MEEKVLKQRPKWMELIEKHPLRVDTLMMTRQHYVETLRFAGASEEEIQRRLEILDSEEAEDLSEVPFYAGKLKEEP